MEVLKDKGAVVTGAASGIGKAFAGAFVEAGRVPVRMCAAREALGSLDIVINCAGLDAADRSPQGIVIVDL